MALQKAALKQGILGLLNVLKAQENQDLAIEEYAEGLSTLIDAFVKTGTVTGSTSNGGTITNGQIL